MKIMVIDDEIATESLFKQRFKDEIKIGLFDFSFSQSAEEALDKLSQLRDTSAVLILSDINMPGMTGLQLLKQLKSEHPSMPVMMVTAYGDEVNHKKAMAYKADGFINKPIDFIALKERIIKFSPKDESSAPPVAEEKKHVTTTKVLVVDDEPALEALIRQKFRNQIKAKEMEFIFASNGVQALEIIDQDNDIGIVLTDINMPEMDGLTLLAKIKEKNRLFRSVVISAYGDMENIRTAMNLGASDFITKPIDLKDLETTLQKIIDQYNYIKDGMTAQHQMIEYHKELEIASRIQQTFIPDNFSSFPGSHKVDIFGKMFSAQQVSGDFFDFFAIGEDKIGFVIADVSGKGVPAAMFMVMSKTLLRSTALANPSPKECMREVSHYLCYNNESTMFVTSFYGVLNINTGELCYCDAGHLPPYILSKDGKLVKLPKEGGIALGVIDDLEQESSLYEEKTIQLQQGDSIILYTDGVTDAINKKGEIYPKERLEEIIKGHLNKDFSLLINDLHNDITIFADGRSQFDDITVMCLHWKG